MQFYHNFIPHAWTSLIKSSKIRKQMSGPDLHVFTLKFLSLKMVFCYQNCSVRKNWPRICKIFEITRTIYSNGTRSKQFLVTESFFNLFLEFFQISKNRTIIQIGKKHWDLEICRKSQKNCFIHFFGVNFFFLIFIKKHIMQLYSTDAIVSLIFFWTRKSCS